MAQKKFSRLSIMLEARDSMSGPILNAARASQTLSGRVSAMGQALNRSRSDVVNATVANRALAEGYRDLATRLGATSEKVNIFTRMFRALPESVRLAAYQLEGYARAMGRAVTQNFLVQSSVKILSATFTGLRAAISNISWDIERGARSFASWFSSTRLISGITNDFRTLGQNIMSSTRYFMQFTTVGRGLSLVGTTFKLIGQAVKETTTDIGNLVRNSLAWKVMDSAIKGVANSMRNLRDQTKVFFMDLPYTIRATDAWRMMAISVEQVKQKVVSARLAFELWKNSSVAVEKVTAAAQKLATPFTKLIDVIRRSVEGLKRFRTQTEETATRGRATFNQLVDANARLNSQLERMNSQLEKGNSLFGKMKSGISSIAGLQKLQIGAQIATGIAERIKEPIMEALNQAAQQDFARKNFGIIVGDQKKGADYYQDVQQFAATTQYAPTEWAQQLTSVMKKVHNSGELNKYMYTMEQLATLMPQQGLEGAAFAMRELAGGQITSLANRFDISKQYLKPLKKETDPMKQAAMLSDMLGKQYGYSVENVQKMKQSPLMQLQAIKNHASNALGQVGSGALDAIAPELSKFNQAFSAGKYNKDLKNLSKVFGDAAKSAISFGKSLYTAVNSSAFKAKIAPIVSVIKQVADGLAKSWPNIKATLADVGSIISKFFAQFNGGKGNGVSKTIQTIFKDIKQLADFINKNFTLVESLTAGAVAAIATFSVLGKIKPLITGFTIAIKALREGELLLTAACWLLDSALLANPFTWVALAVGLLVVAGVALYRNWSTVKTVMVDVFQSIQRTAATMVNHVIDGINSMIDLINKIPGVRVPIIAHVDWGKDAPQQNAHPLAGTKSVLPASVGKGIQMSGGKVAPTNSLSRQFQGFSHRTGINRIPYDNYPAVLHKDERVLTHGEANKYDSKAGGVTVTGNTFIVRQDSDIDAIANALFNKLYAAKTAMG